WVAVDPPDSATGGTAAGGLPCFRGNWAANGVALADGAQSILEHEKFADAAARLFGGAHVTPTTVVVNVNAPMPAGAIHVDIPAFRGANRDNCPLVLLQTMGASGLFERWRLVEAGAVTWLYRGVGGTYDYCPEDVDRPQTQ